MRVLTAHRAAGAVWREAIEGALVLPWSKPCGVCPGGQWEACGCSRLWFTVTHPGLCEVAMVRDLAMDLDDYAEIVGDAVVEHRFGVAAHGIEIAGMVALRFAADPPGTLVRHHGGELLVDPPGAWVV